MKPADIGNWGLLQVVQEGGRLLCQHFRNFMPAIVVCVFPSSLISVVYAQMGFLSPPGVDTQGSTEETAWRFQNAHSFVQPLVMPVTHFLILLAGVLMFRELTNVVYSDADVDTTTTSTTTRHSIKESLLRHSIKETLLDSMILAFVMKDVETENPVLRTTTTESSLYHRIRRTSKGKKLKALVAIFVLIMLYVTGRVVGAGFSPEAMVAMGLLPWMAILVTLPLTFLVTLWTSYLILVYLVMFVWLCSPSLASCDLETDFGGRGNRAVPTVATSSNCCDKEEAARPLCEGQVIPKGQFVENKWQPLLA